MNELFVQSPNHSAVEISMQPVASTPNQTFDSSQNKKSSVSVPISALQNIPVAIVSRTVDGGPITRSPVMKTLPMDKKSINYRKQITV